ncbi:MAG: glycoside hydrolase family 2 [Oscillospiraceae bacterium]|nr:glycoside hydrolase family 2 [Oscillospiraceae bacterium]
MQLPRPEYPRPQFVREDWLCLNGRWDFAFDDHDVGCVQKWFAPGAVFDRQIQVPFAFQSKLSGIGDTGFHDCVWYRREIEIPPVWREKRVLLHFGAVDYETRCYLNGNLIYTHVGGNASFCVDITDYLTYGVETLVLRVFDPSQDETIPRGKQFWQEKSAAIWYTRTTGIWQPVWLEPVSQSYLREVRLTPDVDSGEIGIEATVAGWRDGLALRYTIHFEGEMIVRDSIRSLHPVFSRKVDVFQQKIFRTNFHGSVHGCWTPESPKLYDITFELLDDASCFDHVQSYFGMRKVHTEGGRVYLNNRPYYQKLVLDQGYWPGGLLTAPDDSDFREDIELAKAMGFNGCRKHQKTEDPRFLYWADKMGFLVWGEMASGISYDHNYVERITGEWVEILRRDYNHPCIVTWVPLNESWGIPNASRNSRQSAHCGAMYYLTKSLDPTRPVISNDGWEMTVSDICAIHNYRHGKDRDRQYDHFCKALKTAEQILEDRPSGKAIYATGYSYKGEPILLTEFGGVSYTDPKNPGWGYTSAKTEEEYLETLARVFDAVYNSECLYGFCYTQLTDVEQETNGLLTYDRKPKCDIIKIRDLIDRIVVW